MLATFSYLSLRQGRIGQVFVHVEGTSMDVTDGCNWR